MQRIQNDDGSHPKVGHSKWFEQTHEAPCWKWEDDSAREFEISLMTMESYGLALRTLE